MLECVCMGESGDVRVRVHGREFGSVRLIYVHFDGLFLFLTSALSALPDRFISPTFFFSVFSATSLRHTF